METLYFERRFNGPPASVNGGIAAGAIADRLPGAVRVRLMRPIPLEQELILQPPEDGVGLIARHGDSDIMSARCEALELEVPPPPRPDRIAAAGRNYRKPPDNSFSDCFVCGHARAAGDGLRVHAGCDPSQQSFAALHWIPHEKFADDDGRLPNHMIWGSLDCPAAIAGSLLNKADMRTGEMHGEVYGPVLCGRTYTVFAWPIRAEGRKVFTGCALIDGSGNVCAKASVLWITVA
jgi:hypothetical protein